MDVVIDAYDLPLDVRPQLGDARNQLFDGDALRQGINTWEIAFHEYFVHDSHRSAAGQILIRELSSLVEADAERTEIFWRDHIESGAGALGRIVHCFPDNLKRHAKTGAAKRYARGDGHCRDTWQSLDSVAKLAIERINLVRRSKLVVRNRKVKREQMVATKPEIYVLDVPEAVNGHSAACEQTERQREFGNHERATQPVPATAERAAAFLQHVVQ